MSPKAKHVKYISPYRLKVEFFNGEMRLFNLEPYLIYPVYEKLADEAFSAKATVENGLVVWDKETDMDPDRLYLESEPLLSMEKGLPTS